MLAYPSITPLVHDNLLPATRHHIIKRCSWTETLALEQQHFLYSQSRPIDALSGTKSAWAPMHIHASDSLGLMHLPREEIWGVALWFLRNGASHALRAG
jgi:hypothetical protein